MFRHWFGVLLALLGVVSPHASVWGLPPCGTPGTITTVTAPDGDYLAAFSGYTIYPPEHLSVGGGVDLAASPDYRSYQPVGLALDIQGRVYVADQTIIYRLEADGTATRIVGVPQYSFIENDEDTWRVPLLQRTNVLQDTVAALDARIGPGAMAFDRQGRLHFVDYVDRNQLNNFIDFQEVEARIARLAANGQVVTVVGPIQVGYISSLMFDLEGHLLMAGTGGIRRMDGQGIITTLLEADYVGKLLIDGQGVLYFAMDNQVFRRHADGEIEHVAGSDWGDPTNLAEVSAMTKAALEGEWKLEERLGGYYVANGRPATEAPFHYLADMVLDTQGTLYIANANFHRIHRVRPDGILETIAGNGVDFRFSLGCPAVKRVAGSEKFSGPDCQDHIGDGGSALEAPIWWPSQLLLTPEDDLLVVMSGGFGGWDWSGGSFSQLRRICRVSKWGVPTAIETVEEQASANLAEEALSALRLYPNPFNAAVTIAFELEHSASVSVHIYNELGQQVRVLAAEGVRPAGNYQFVWDGRDQAGQFQASGTYLLVLAVDGAVETHKLTLLH
ncbi:MAG: T9SS type A sorting domain-containing protein [Gemmatimonadetes bacterium]|nr:T9SS type A sorting domain-containing protein [Gemmatimonadota bacterium]